MSHMIKMGVSSKNKNFNRSYNFIFCARNKIRMKYIGIIYDCTLIGTKHKNKQVLINDHKDLNNLIQEMDKKTKGSH